MQDATLHRHFPPAGLQQIFMLGAGPCSWFAGIDPRPPVRSAITCWVIMAFSFGRPASRRSPGGPRLPLLTPAYCS